MNVNIFGRNSKKPMTMAPRSKARSLLPLEHWDFEFESNLGRFLSNIIVLCINRNCFWPKFHHIYSK